MKFIYGLLTLTFLSMTINQAYAAEYVLVKEKSEINYSIVKYKGLPLEDNVKGTLTEESKESLKGNVSIDDLSDFSDISGTITLSKPEFNSDNTGRDEEVVNMLTKASNKSITISLDNSNLKISNNLAAGTFEVTINEITEKVKGAAKVVKREQSGKEFVIVAGKMGLDRQKFDVSVTGFAAIGDGLIEDNLEVSFKLVFVRTK